MHDIIKDLNWRYATKKFDSSKRISDHDFEVIKESLRLVPTSYGLQPLKFIVVESPELRRQLQPISYNQSQIVDASHLIIICSYRDIDGTHVDEYVANIGSTRNVETESIKGYADFMKVTIGNMEDDQKFRWNKNQAYIALGQLMHTCASLKIDATPMEGFNANAYDELLGLRDQNLTAALVVPMGYRHGEDETQHQKKVRKSQDDLFINL
jgi:nitroreductase / dihydropteridine reductase